MSAGEDRERDRGRRVTYKMMVRRVESRCNEA
jgi:hypothetical protein